MLRSLLTRFRKPVEAPQTASDHARALSRLGHEQARSTVLAKARQMRAEQGLAPDWRLG